MKDTIASEPKFIRLQGEQIRKMLTDHVSNCEVRKVEYLQQNAKGDRRMDWRAASDQCVTVARACAIAASNVIDGPHDFTLSQLIDLINRTSPFDTVEEVAERASRERDRRPSGLEMLLGGGLR